MGCYLGPSKNVTDDIKEQPLRKNSRSSGRGLRNMKTTRNNLAKYYLKFPRINKAYKTLFTGWCEAIEKSVGAKATASDIFNLEGPVDKASNALSRAGILVTNKEILDALNTAATSPRDNKETLRFKDLVIAVGALIKDDGEGLKQFEDKKTYHIVKKGFMIIKEMFGQIDEDGSGEISMEEFTAAFADLSHGDESGIQEKRMGELDFNHDHEISYPEFCVGLSVWVGFVDGFESESE